MIIPGTPQTFILKMIIGTLLPYLIGGGVLFVAAIVGVCFVFSGWSLFFAILGVVVASVLAVAAFAYYKVRQMKKKMAEQMSGLQNMFNGMMSGGGMKFDNLRNVVIDEKVATAVGAAVGTGATLLTNAATKAEDGAENAKPDAASIQIESTDLMEFSDEFLISAMKEELSEEEFAKFEALNDEDKKRVLQVYREAQMMDEEDDLMAMFAGEDGTINPFAPFANMSEEELKAAQEMNPFEVMQNMSEEEKQQAQQMMQQMMAMFGGAGIDMSKLEERMSNLGGKNPLLAVEDVPVKSEVPK